MGRELKEFYIFSMGITPKVNVIAELEVQLTSRPLFKILFITS